MAANLTFQVRTITAAMVYVLLVLNSNSTSRWLLCVAIRHKIAECQLRRNGLVEDSDQPDGAQLARFIQKDTAAREAVELTNRSKRHVA